MKKAESYIVLEHELDTYRKIMTQAAQVILEVLNGLFMLLPLKSLFLSKSSIRIR